MVSVTITEKGGKPQVREFNQPEITVGRVQGNDIVLPKSNISKRHARIVRSGNAFVVIDAKSTNGTYVNGKRISAPHDLRAGDKVFVGDFTLEVKAAEDSQSERKSGPKAPAGAPAERRQAKTKELAADDEDILPDSAWNGPDEDWGGDWAGEKESPEEADADLVPDGPPAARPSRPATGEARPAALQRTGSHSKKRRPEGSGKTSLPEEQSGIVRVVHERLMRSMDPKVDKLDDAALRARISEGVREIVAQMHSGGELPRDLEPGMLVDCVLSEALGLGPLEELLNDPSVTEILVNNARQIFIERDGRLEPSNLVFSSDQAVMSVIERIVAPLGRRIDETSPMVDARLKDGSRVNAVVPPLSVKGPTITIRKFTREPLQIDDLVAGGSLNADMAEFLETCVKARKNVLISGGTGSGKTTLLNVLSSFIDSTERIITIEDAAELKLDQEHVVSLEARPANMDGRGAVSIRDLVKNALRMRPDRIIVGECRGGETLDMLQAMNTGHDGSLTTVHANGPRDALSRLETMVLMAGMELPVRAIRDQVANAVDIVVQQSRFTDGTRRITHISEITGMEGEIISMHDLFVFDHQGITADGRVQGRFRATGFIPKFYENLRSFGLEANLAIFRNT
jgi:pilus assembly protein CpaF